MPGMARLRRFSAALLTLCCLAATNAGAAGADPAPAELSRAARVACEDGRRAPDRATRLADFERGKSLALQAVKIDERNAEAHFALFCNMGELMRIDGESISSVFQLRRLMGELDKTLAIDPGHTDALSSKGQLLVRLPRLLGGDVQQGEAMLRQVVQKDPNAFTSRLALAKTCEARGDRDEAMAFATRALQIAREQGRADKVAEAQATLAELRASR